MNTRRWLKTNVQRQAGSFEMFRLHILYCRHFWEVFACVLVLGKSILGVSFTQVGDR